MNDLLDHLDDLTPDQRELLDLLLEEQGVGQDAATDAAPIAPFERPDGRAPLSFAQQRLWFLDQLERAEDGGSSPMYNMPAAARIRVAPRHALSVPVLQAALDEIARRHEVLRTIFAAGEDGEGAQLVLPSLHVPLTVVDLPAQSGEDQEQELIRLAAAEAQRPFDLSSGPLVRVTLLVLSGQDFLLLLNMHHIVTDGWSIGVFLRELGELYAAFAAGRPSPLPPLPLQYGDYALWQRDPQQAQVLEKQSAYWCEALAGAPGVLELPFDRPRPAVQTYNGAAAEFVVPVHVQAALNQLARAEGATLFMTLLSAFQVVLYRYSRQADICVGTPIANRTRGELEGLIGFFANTLVLRGQLSPHMPYREFLRRTREVTLAAYEHQDVPFEQVVDAVQPERSLSYAPLFQVMFVLQNTPQQARQLPGMSLSTVHFPSITAKFDLTLNMSEQPDGISAAIEYNTDLFDRVTIGRFIEHFQNLCAAIAARPDLPVGVIPLLPGHEEERLLREWNATGTDVDLDRRIHELVEAQVDRTPEAVAVVFRDQRITYGELDQRSNRLAHHLRSLGAGPESLVGVCMERSPDLIVALLGVLKAGAAYVPMDPRYPRERLEFMAADARVAALIAESAVADAAPANAPHIIFVDRERDMLAAQPSVRPQRVGTSRNLSYVLFTSGSTGRPKGVAIQHRSAIALIRWAQRVFPADSLSAVLASTSISFDLSVYEIFVTLSTGGRLVLVENALDLAGALARNPAVEGIRLINTVPSAAAELLRLGAIPDSVRTVNLAGEPLAQQLVGQLYDLPFVQDVYDLYGPTEDTTYSTYTRRVRGGAATIGRPIDNTQAYVLDEFFNPTPQGVPGEVYLAGAGLARGYLNRPELTAERFIPNPFATVPGDRMYRTGDLARYRGDGTLQYLGRIDHQVKLRGFRIELGEIENAIEAYRGVGKSVVLVREDAPGDKQLVAYVEGDGALPRPDFAALRSELSRRLPAHMIPAAYVEIKQWPLSPNGKIDRRRLPAPGVSAAHERVRVIAPRTPVEEGIAGTFASVLRLAQVSIDDDFFHLGGHSLLATQLVSRVRRAFDVDLPLRAVFVTPTVAGLAATVEGLLRQGAGSVLPAIGRAPREPDEAGAVRLPLSFAQQRLWFLDQLEPGSTLYNIPSAVRLSGRLDDAALRRTLDALAGRHESLRTTFEAVDGKPVQVIGAQGTLALDLIDLSGVAGEQQQAAVMEQAVAEARKPFDLAAGPLVRAALLRLADTEHVLLITMHHIISDGWSTGVIVREFAQFYAAFSSGAEPDLEPLELQHADYAAWQREWLLSEGEGGSPLQRQLAYWREALQDAPALLELPTDRPRPAVQSHHGASLAFDLPPALANRVREISREEGATVFMTLMAAFQALLSRLSSQTDVCVGTPVANRTRADLEGIVGFFVNTLVLRSDLGDNGGSGAPSFRALLRQVRSAALGAYAHQDVPFERLIDELDIPRDMSHSPLFQVMFVWQEQRQNALGRAVDLPGLTLAPIPIHGGTTAFDLTLAMADSGASMGGWLEYATELFDRATAERFARYFETLLEGMLAEPDRPVAHVSMLTSEERQTVVEAWNDTAAPVPSLCLHEAFEQQVERTPDALALEFAVVGEQRQPHALTYAELNRLADALGCELQRMGVGHEEIVAISVEKSVEQLAGLLGILKAGAAYLPIDPAYPAERIAYLLADSGARVLLTQSHLAERFAAAPLGQVLCLDEFAAGPLPGAAARPERRATPASLAYVIYTSGSTGQPKGVMVEHRSIVNHAHALMAQTCIGLGDRMLQFVSLSFDAAGEEFYPTLLSGAALVLPGDGALGSRGALLGPDLPAFCEQHRVTIVHMPATAWHGIVDDLAVRGVPWRSPLRLLMLGGDAPDPARLAAFMKLLGREIPFINLYGPTEATITATSYRTTDFTSARRLPIGRPIANARIYVLDRARQPVPVGVPGEIYIGGAGVARGYLNRPSLTAERFVQADIPVLAAAGSSNSNEFAQFATTRLYRTGDTGRWLPDGAGGGLLEFLGRADDQVKIRGYRIEPGEVEAALAQHPGVKECVVVAREDATGGGKRLVAYLAPASEQPPSIAELRSFLLAALPDYMVPAVFVVLPALPVNAHGKVDRKALPAPAEAGRAETGSEFVAPTTPAEQTLAGIWAGVLGVPHVGVNDNFFELGGDSILSIQVIARANQAGLHLTPKQLFQAPTIAALAAVAGTQAAATAEQGPVVGPVSLTPIQRHFFEMELADRNHWNQSVLLSVGQRLAPESLRAAILALVEHHDALRLRFVETENGWEAFAAAPDPRDEPPFEHVDLAGLSGDDFSAAVQRLGGETQKTLDISRGPLFRAVYYDAGRDRPGRLLIVAHHLAVDGVSWRVLLEDLQNGYGQHTKTGAVRLPPKTTSFKAWAEKLADHAQSEQTAAELDFWLERTSGWVPPLPLDFSGDLAGNTEAAAAQVGVTLSQEETGALLTQAGAAYNTEVQDLLLTALAQAIEKWTGTPALYVHLEGHGREELGPDADVSRTVGWFTSLYPVRLDLPWGSEDAPGETIVAVKEQLRAVPNHGLGYGLLRHLGAGEAKQALASQGEPELTFNYLGQFDQVLNAAEVEALLGPAPEVPGRDRAAENQRTHLIDVTAAVAGHRLSVSWTYSRALHDEATVQQLADWHLQALQNLIAHCRSPEAGAYTPSDFPLAELDQKQLDKVLNKVKRGSEGAR